MTYNTFYFIDEATGEDFFVEADTIKEARAIANENFEDPTFIRIVSYEEAEDLGFDTY